MLPLNHKVTKVSLAPTIFYVKKKSAIKRLNFHLSLGLHKTKLNKDKHVTMCCIGQTILPIGQGLFDFSKGSVQTKNHYVII